MLIVWNARAFPEKECQKPVEVDNLRRKWYFVLWGLRNLIDKTKFKIFYIWRRHFYLVAQCYFIVVFLIMFLFCFQIKTFWRLLSDKIRSKKTSLFVIKYFSYVLTLYLNNIGTYKLRRELYNEFLLPSEGIKAK